MRVSAPNYTTVSLTDVIVKPGEITPASTVMSNKGLGDQGGRGGKARPPWARPRKPCCTERKLSAVVSDSIGHEELASGTSSDAAGALEKVTGVSVVGERIRVRARPW